MNWSAINRARVVVRLDISNMLTLWCPGTKSENVDMKMALHFRFDTLSSSSFFGSCTVPIRLFRTLNIVNMPAVSARVIMTTTKMKPRMYAAIKDHVKM